MRVELRVGPRRTVNRGWQTISFNREDEARAFIALMCREGYEARPAGETDYRHDFDSFTG